jgi:flagellum-specific ATP synthase
MRNHYPAIDVLASISRLMNEIVDRKHMKIAGEIRRNLSLYRDNSDLISIGAYKSGTNPELDKAIEKVERINAFLRQEIDEKVDFEQMYSVMEDLVS